jgi:hypothetical protein
MKDLPETIARLLESGKKRLLDDRAQLAAQLEKNKREEIADAEIRKKKSWRYLCLEVSVDLESVSQYVDTVMPENFKAERGDRRFVYIRIPGCTEIAADYSCKDYFQWEFNRFVVACYDRNGKAISKSWLIVDKGLDYAIAIAHEQKGKLDKLEAELKKPEPPVRLAEIVMEEIDDSCGGFHHGGPVS